MCVCVCVWQCAHMCLCQAVGVTVAASSSRTVQSLQVCSAVCETLVGSLREVQPHAEVLCPGEAGSPRVPASCPAHSQQREPGHLPKMALSCH